MTGPDGVLNLDVAAARRAAEAYVHGGPGERIVGDVRNDGLRLLVAAVGGSPAYGTVTVRDEVEQVSRDTATLVSLDASELSVQGAVGPDRPGGPRYCFLVWRTASDVEEAQVRSTGGAWVTMKPNAAGLLLYVGRADPQGFGPEARLRRTDGDWELERPAAYPISHRGRV